MAPSLYVARNVAAASGKGGNMTATRSPAPTPWSRSAFAVRFVSACMSPNVSERSFPCQSSQNIARRDGSCLSRTSAAML
jgi:hypothetical protein